MFNPFDIQDHDLSAAITAAFVDLNKYDAESEDYQKIVNQLTELYALKHNVEKLSLDAQIAYAAHQQTIEAHQLAVDAQQLACDQNAWQEEQDQRSFLMRISPDTALIVAGNLALGLAVIKYEQTGVIASKVLSFMRKI